MSHSLIKISPVVSDVEIENAFLGANYGQPFDKKEHLQQAMLKVIRRFRNGCTTVSILKSLGLVTQKGNLSKKGREFLYEAFNNND